MLDEIYTALESLGYSDFDGSDELILNLIAENVKQHIKGFCNITNIPKDLHHVFISNICGEFLYQKYNSGTLPGNFDFETLCSSISEISEGDISISFNADSALSAEQRFLSMINKLRSPDYDCLIRRRKLVW